MKYSTSQVSPAHASAARRPTHQTQHATGHPATLPSQVPGPARAGTESGPASTAGFIPDLATGAKSLADSLEILTRTASETLAGLMDSPVECAIVLKRVKNIPATAGTSPEAALLARLEQEAGEGPLTEALAGNGTVAMNHVTSDFRWARYRPHLQNAGFDSVLGLRLRLDDGAEAALAFFAPGAQAFPLHVIAAARNFADLAARGLMLVLELQTTSTRASDLQSALESRTSIDIACGVIMAQNRCSYDDAIAIIAKASSHRNLKLRKVAEGILEKLPGGAPRTHFEH
ncbi:GAF and ANTAR domain-containing protein [Pseudarthrobacter sp. BIM B-2242]|nr:GAF and ANTAR domain-containing protein [Pseudarthrobacter sp. BIM B-2242]